MGHVHLAGCGDYVTSDSWLVLLTSMHRGGAVELVHVVLAFHGADYLAVVSSLGVLFI